MQAAAHGGARNISISPEKAAEYVSGQSPKGLPERVGKKPKRNRHLMKALGRG